ncbi:MAG: rhodanese-related sulfurtransferase [Minisyncoccia bacterium]
MTADYTIILFYKYVRIENPEEVRLWQDELSIRLGLKGRCIIAAEGINTTFEGTTENIQKYIKELEKDSRFLNIHFKLSKGTGRAFPKLSVKVRKEIVSLHLGACDIDPNIVTGEHLKPEELHAWIKDKKPARPGDSGHSGREFYIVDMRNVYEHKVGHFENSILPPIENFRDLPKVVEQIAHLKNKTVLTVCTGGVRCEKASGFLITQGFTDVYQLDGGIVSYMEKYPNEDFKGKLYVFDGRVTMGPSQISRAGFYTDDEKFTRMNENSGGQEVVGKCDTCGALSENYVNCANPVCHRHFINCEKCLVENEGKAFCVGGCVLSRHGRKISPVEANLIE